ncbi:MAG TPA: substrate-binding domain-containing protein [Oscillospiraceae bacterium]|nr:substrate-binding domain-containing protein [Oscillospiraceae bacterium]HPF55749.1 substrate-binding domain-containing protein [Clostridiales bacterium]HPK34254.1 substrate-binding domain-containing protein [Oscillospiraceae bacterium]HPR74843.1 substrate-binding domain-containing protein [Oscillospiraceae bacterium]
MKKFITFVLSAVLLCTALIGCEKTPESSASAVTPITVISRESGSGTRGAFIELFGIEQKDADGNKVDYTIDTALINSSTGVVLTNVASDANAIGYISLGALNDTVKALEIDGVAATVENIKNDTYSIYRPFNIVTYGEVGDLAQDFIDFILSTEGQAIVEANSYIPLDGVSAYAGTKPSGTITIAGSSSVTPLMEKLVEAYLEINTNATIEVQQSDSTSGVKSTLEGVCEIGMASRELKDSELESGAVPTVIALDGIAVIVNIENAIDGLTSEQVLGIYTGTIVNWEDIA